MGDRSLRERSLRRRRLVCHATWLACLPGLVGYAMLTAGLLAALGKGGEVEEGKALEVAFVYGSFAAGWFAWYALLAMSRAWLRNKALSLTLPSVGTLAAIIGFTPLASHWWPIVLVSPGVALAGYLVIWHTRGEARSG